MGRGAINVHGVSDGDARTDALGWPLELCQDRFPLPLLLLLAVACTFIASCDIVSASK